MDAVFWGGTGQAKVLRPIVEAAGHRLIAVFDRDDTVRRPFEEVPLFHDESKLQDLLRNRSGPMGFVVAIGGDRGRDRVVVGDRLSNLGLVALSPQHETAWIAATAALNIGCQVLAMAAVSEGAILGRYCIVNTSASIDHECKLGDGVHVMPGAVLAGEVTVADCATVGSNATILPRLRIGESAIVAAGAVVTQDVADGTVVAGVPARPIDVPRRPGPLN